MALIQLIFAFAGLYNIGKVIEIAYNTSQGKRLSFSLIITIYIMQYSPSNIF